MSIDVRTCAPDRTLDALADAIDDAKAGERLAPVSVVVPTNVTAVMARRALGRRGGLVGVDMLTLGRLAELVAGPSLAAARRQPVSAPVVELTIREVLDEAPGMFAPVRHHAATITALREAHEQLRLAGDRADALDASRRGAEVRRVSRAVDRRLRRRWYDEADVVATAIRLVADGSRAGSTPPAPIVVHLPQRLAPLHADLVTALAASRPVTVVVALTGDAAADRSPAATLDRLGSTSPPTTAPDPGGEPRDDGVGRPRPLRVVTTTDADDEVRLVARTVIDAARGGVTGEPVPFERIAVLWPAHRPYARLVEHHLTADHIPWNGRGGTEVTERIAPRLLLDLLDVDLPRLRRHALFEVLADVPARTTEGRLRPSAQWERTARRAGVTDDWHRALRRLAGRPGWEQPATDLLAFVDELRTVLGPPSATRTWRDWADWSVGLLDHWLGARAAMRFDDGEYRAWEALVSALDRLRRLDDLTEPVDRPTFRRVLHAELDAAVVREGRIGHGVTIGSLASAPGLDVDLAIVVGAADGLLPPGPRPDPLLTDADRALADLERSDDRADRLLHAFRWTIAAVPTVVIAPRGDLRGTVELLPSRWLDDVSSTADRDEVASAIAGLREHGFPPTARERRLRDRLRAATAGPLTSDAAELAGDPTARRAITTVTARALPSLTAFDGDLSHAGVPRLGATPISPSQIETWASCPYAYFVRYLLGVREIDDPELAHAITPRDAGSLLHEVLDRFHGDVVEGRLPQADGEGWGDAHRDRLLAHFDDCCADAEVAGRSGRPATWVGERLRMRSELVAWLAADSDLVRARHATVLRSEHRFGQADEGEPGGAADAVDHPVSLPLPGGRRIPIHGAVDRVDLLADGGVVVTDHKTGRGTDLAKLTTDDPTLGATRFQLPAYAAAALALVGGDESTPVRAEYSLFEQGGYARPGVDLDAGVWNRVSDALDHVVSGIEDGWFPQRPEAPGFRLYNACPFCDPDHIGTDEAHRRWSIKSADPRVRRWFGEPGAGDSESSDG